MYIYVGTKGLPCNDFRAQVYTVELHGPFGYQELGACRDAGFFAISQDDSIITFPGPTQNTNTNRLNSKPARTSHIPACEPSIAYTLDPKPYILDTRLDPKP